MAYRKGTLRSMSPVTRKVARLIGEQQSVAKRLKNLIPELQRLELDSRALETTRQPARDTQDELLNVLSFYLTLDPADQRMIDFLRARLKATEIFS